MNKYAVLIFVSVALLSCKDNKGVDLHLNYQPMESGLYVIYDAKEVFIDGPSAINDTSEYLLKVGIGVDYVDNEDRLNKEVVRSVSTDGGQTWSVADVWYLYRDLTRAELIEENERKVKLTFAPTFDKDWDINAYNSKEEQRAIYEVLHESYSINGTQFDSTLTVRQADFTSLVDYDKELEVYAKGVGMIQKYFKNLTINNFDTLDIVKGQELYLNYRSHGYE